MTGVAESVDKDLRPLLEAEAEKISEEFPSIAAIVSSFVDSSVSRYVLNLECLLKEATVHEPDLVVLCISVEQLTTLPSINVDISWGDPSGYVEAELFESPLPVSETTVKAIKKALPDFFRTLRSIIGKRSRRSV